MATRDNRVITNLAGGRAILASSDVLSGQALIVSRDGVEACPRLIHFEHQCERSAYLREKSRLLARHYSGGKKMFNAIAFIFFRLRDQGILFKRAWRGLRRFADGGIGLRSKHRRI